MNIIHKDYQKLEIPVAVKMTALYAVTHKLIYKFPKHERYSLGEKIEKNILKVIELLILANQASKYEKEKILLTVNSKIEVLKIIFRICLDCQIIDDRVYLETENRLQEAGKMTQGWIKYTRNSK